MGECCQFCGAEKEKVRIVWYSGTEWMCEGCASDHIRMAMAINEAIRLHGAIMAGREKEE